MMSSFFIWRHVSLFLTGQEKMSPCRNFDQNLTLAQAEELRSFDFLFNLVSHVLCDFDMLEMYRWRVSYIFPNCSKNYKNDHNICWKKQFLQVWCKSVILRHVTSFSYIFPYKWRHNKNADVIKNNDVRLKMGVKNKSSNRTVLCVWRTAYVSMFAGF